MELNLEPASVTKKKLLRSKQPFMILSALCLLLTLAGGWLYCLRATDVERQVTEKLTPQVASLRVLAAEFDKTKTEIDQAQATAAPFVTAVKERDYWARVINDINTRLPQTYIWITAFSPVNLVDGKVVATEPAGRAPLAPPGGPGAGHFSSGLRLHGLYLTSKTQLVNDFADNLSKSPFVASVANPTRTTPTQTEWDFDYELVVELKQGIAPQ
jgi:Tfp pilus assembly protein PilN